MGYKESPYKHWLSVHYCPQQLIFQSRFSSSYSNNMLVKFQTSIHNHTKIPSILNNLQSQATNIISGGAKLQSTVSVSAESHYNTLSQI